jgi:cell division protein FtsB
MRIITPSQLLNKYPIALWLIWGLICISLIGLFTTLILKSYRQATQFEIKNQHCLQKIDTLKTTIRHEENYLKTITENSAFLERIAREKLGYKKDNELLFIF